ncbi:MAG: hypothetical protein GC166_01060 [Alphaproteobacteria bacterium]|nr:hypothetical protein [Alphaproteobacteria bacterium]
MRVFAGVVLAAGLLATPAMAADDCPGVKGDVAIAARTPQVDLYSEPTGARVQTVEKAKFPGCIPITGRAPNMMLQIDLAGTPYWVPPHMVKYRFSGKLPAVCRNLALGSNDTKAGATRGLGEDCPKTKVNP